VDRGIGGIDRGEIRIIGVLPLLESAGQGLAGLRGDEARLDVVLLKEPEDTAVSGGVHLVGSQQNAHGVERSPS
jgi:hypothetical protein